MVQAQTLVVTQVLLQHFQLLVLQVVEVVELDTIHKVYLQEVLVDLVEEVVIFQVVVLEEQETHLPLVPLKGNLAVVVILVDLAQKVVVEVEQLKLVKVTLLVLVVELEQPLQLLVLQ